jgi:putative DNA primase/helicase
MKTLCWEEKMLNLEIQMHNFGIVAVQGCSQFAETLGVQRFDEAGDKPGAKSVWFTLHDDLSGCSFGSWKLDIKSSYFFNCARNIRSTWSERSKAINVAKQFKIKKILEQNEAAIRCQKVFERSLPASSNHKYLVKKLISSIGLRQQGNQLLIPMYNLDDAFINLQRIDPYGNKRFWPNARLDNAVHWFGRPELSHTLLICEGYATGASIYRSMNFPVAVSFSSNSLCSLSTVLRAKYPNKTLVICADNDKLKETNTGINPGLIAGNKAVEACGGIMVYPSIHSIYLGTDFNDMANEYCDRRVYVHIMNQMMDQIGYLKKGNLYEY